ncbi:MAG: aliphatic sulfonate ABC transporter substrate-binding protein [Azoarcus sp.]|jgi:sulfonate transport system substrate-binding protein|nr:aliphatic sulfonate ABC transporter substrate-binding protein [Azoarcus sp.]
MKKNPPRFNPGKRAALARLLGLAATPALAPLSALAPSPAFAQTPNPESFRVGYQKGTAILIVSRQRRDLEDKLRKTGIDKVDWIEFQFGPPMLEAITAQSIDIGSVGDTPPIFAQAGGGDIVYALTVPSSPHGIIVPDGSPIRALPDLKGKRVAFGKGSSAHNILLKALKIAGLSYNDIQPTYLGPAEATAAFTGGKIDAWVIWDPYYALAEEQLGARVIASTEQIPELASNSFYIANRHFAQRHPAILRAALDSFIETIAWADKHRDEVAALAAKSTGLDLSIQKRAFARAPLSYSEFTEAVLTEQQATADEFFKHRLIPKKIDIREIVWRG